MKNRSRYKAIFHFNVYREDWEGQTVLYTYEAFYFQLQRSAGSKQYRKLFFFFFKNNNETKLCWLSNKKKKKKEEKLRVLGYLPCAAFWLSFHTWLSVKGDGVRHGHCRMEGQTPGQFSCKHLTTVKRTKKQNKVNVVSWLHLLIKDKGTSEVFLATVYYFVNLSVSFTTDHTFQDLVMCTKL